MPSFGAFETVREVYSGPAYTVYSARKAGDVKSEYAIKVFSTRQLGLEEESVTELGPLLADLEQSCAERISIQQQAAAASPFICPILERGQDERGVWYATRFYPRSVNKLISGRVALTQAALWHIVYAIASGALAMKRSCGRSHGDIQASAVQISHSDKVVDAEVVLSDPLPGGKAEAIRYEISDLRAVGRVLLQLVLQREITEEDDFLVLLPIAVSAEWERLFGENAERWVKLCNRLLHPDLSLGEITLEQLLQELEQLQIKPRFSGRQVALAAGAVVLVFLLSLVVLIYYKKGTLSVGSDPPGAEIKLKAESAAAYQSYGKTPAGGASLVLKRLPKGRYSLVAEYPGLATQTNIVTVEGGKKRSFQVAFPYGSLKVTSVPSGAVVELDKKPVGTTPYASPLLSPGLQLNYTLKLPDHELARLSAVVPAQGQTLAVHTNLVQLEAGMASVEFTSRPEGVMLKENGVVLCTTPEVKILKIGRHKITAEFEDWPTTNFEFEVVKGENAARDIYLPHGIARFAITPSEATIKLNGKSPVKGIRSRALRPGDYTIQVEQEGFYPTNKTITIVEGQTTNILLALRPMRGFVEFTSEPPGATVYEANGRILGTTRAGEPVKQSYPPGKYSFYARLDEFGLDPVTNKDVMIGMGMRVPLDLMFEHGTIQFETDPPGASVLVGGRALKPTPYTHYQKPGSINYRLESPDYYAVNGSTNLAPRSTVRVVARLRRREVPLLLRSDPPGARFYLNGRPLLQTNDGRFYLEWGPQQIVARYPAQPQLPELDPVTNSVVVDKNGGSQSTMTFSYALLEITNNEPEATLLYANKPVTNLPAKLLLRPDMRYDFVLDGGPEFRTNLPPVTLAASVRSILQLVLPELRQTFNNSLGMKFEWVPGLPGGGDWGDSRHTNGGWICAYEVTQAQYSQVMRTNPSAFKCPDPAVYPVENLTLEQATDFCRRLPAENRGGRVWQYRLPTDAQYEFFAADADRVGKVTSQGMAKSRTNPEKVGSLKANKFRLYDIVGNVAEWVDAPPDPITKGWTYRGGSYLSLVRGASSAAREANQDSHPTVGFRVILVPAR